MHENGINGVNGVQASANGSKHGHHPLDPLTKPEIEVAVELVRKDHGNIFFNTVTLQEPRKAAMLTWLADPDHATRPPRIADVVVLGKGGKVFEGLVDLDREAITEWKAVEEEQPLVSQPFVLGYAPLKLPQIHMDDLQFGEEIVRNDPKVIEQCEILGIPKEDMHKVYCDCA